MNSSIAGYSLIELLHESANTLIYRAAKNSGPTAIVKTLRSEYPTLEELARLRHEFQILQPLEIAGIAKPLALESYQNGLALILPDCGGESLKRLLATRSLELSQFLLIAVPLAATIAALHQNTIIHKDIKPDNILVNLETGQVKIIDFGISSRLSQESQTVSNPNLLEGTLAYMSPEQTGRMNRLIDYRTDFYSLGATFYAMLTGQLPFPTTDLLELVHCHISGIAHDLNNALAPITMSVQLLQQKVQDQQSQQSLNILESNTQWSTDLVRQVLSFARGVDGQRTTLQVEHLISEIEQIAKQTFPRPIEIQTDVPARDFWTISGDSTQLHQVLMNLCVNARDAMPEGSPYKSLREICGLMSIMPACILTQRLVPMLSLLYLLLESGFPIASSIEFLSRFSQQSSRGKGQA